MERYARSRLPLGPRVFAGFGFWVVGLSAVGGGLVTGADTIGTKMALYGAVINSDGSRQAHLENVLEQQQTRMWVDLASAVACISIGANMTRRVGQLWSGTVYEQEVSGEAPNEQSLPPAPSVAKADAIGPATFGNRAA